LENDKISYIFIDDVSVTLIGSTTECSCPKKKVEQTNGKQAPHGNSNEIKINYQIIDSITLGDVSFNSSSWEIHDDEIMILNNLARKIQTDSLQIIVISGHTDSTGIESKNIELSLKRAKSVTDYLIQNGVSKERINYFGYGSEFPIFSNLTTEARSKNRRVEIKIYKQRF